MANRYYDCFLDDEYGASGNALALKPVRTVAPATGAITLAEVKKQAVIDFNDDDDEVQRYLDTAIDQLDGYDGLLGRALVNQTWRQDFSSFRNVMRLPLEPLQSVTSVKYYDGDNVQQTFSPSGYVVYTDARSPIVALSSGGSWPTTYSRPDAVSITFVAGYGALASDVPSRIRSAALLHAADLYNNRETSSAEQRYSTMAYERLIKPFQRVY